jgi:hypothetical protein
MMAAGAVYALLFVTMMLIALALVGPTARGAARLLIGEGLTTSARPDDFRT